MFHTLFTIGHGARKKEVFVDLLKQFKIEHLIDVRSQPYSRFHPQFSQKNLKQTLENNGIGYLFMGDTLGGRPKDDSLYDDSGKIDYDLVRRTHFFKKGEEILKMICKENSGVVIMCSERDPRDCHRSKLIGRSLIPELSVIHIDQDGRAVRQEDLFEPDLFPDTWL